MSSDRLVNKSTLRHNYEQAKLELENQISSSKPNKLSSADLIYPNDVKDSFKLPSPIDANVPTSPELPRVDEPPARSCTNPAITSFRSNTGPDEAEFLRRFDTKQESKMFKDMPRSSITEKPNERCPSPLTPAYANYELAKRMHEQNLEHQPLPDSVADLAYQRENIKGGFAGLALDIDPMATGVGIKTHNAGPTHCTKMRVYRPKTCRVIPATYNGDSYRPNTSIANKKMGAMDLAICWDYRPENPMDDTPVPKRIDGSNDNYGTAVFNCVKTPREDLPPITTRNSAGVFNNTMGESDFFDKDIIRNNKDFVGKPISNDDPCQCSSVKLDRPRSKSIPKTDFDKDFSSLRKFDDKLSPVPHMTNNPLYDKFLDNEPHYRKATLTSNNKLNCDNAGFFRRMRNRQCHKISPEASCNRSVSCHALHKPPIFKTGIPQYNSGGALVPPDNGCHGNSRVLVVPRPKNPYSKKKYDIDTLIPPFRCLGGGAAEGGYPEHWRLSSVYQHAYKPIQQRRRPLLHTVYK